MRNRAKNLLSLLLTLILLMAAAAAPAETMHREVDNAAIEMEAELGYDGVITYGKMIPLRVRVRNRGGDIEGRLGINAYVNTKEYDRYEMDVSLPSGTEKEFVLPLKVMRKQDIFTVEITSEGETLYAVNIPAGTVANPSAMMIGVLSTRPRQLSNLTIDRENDPLFRYEYWQTVALTADSFPDSEALMESFGILVLDDVDPATLTSRQQETLLDWLKAGHIVLSGGGAYAERNTAFLSSLTGLRTDGMETVENVLPALEEFAALSRSRKSVSAALAKYAGTEPLVTDGEGRGLIWRSEAGNGRVYTMAFEAGDAALNAESVMHILWQQVFVKYDATLYNSVLYGNSNSQEAVVYAGYDMPVQARGFLPAGILIAAAVPVLACLIWLALKKKDKRRWMWVLIPVLSVAAAAAVAVLSGSSELNRPMAVYSSNILQTKDGVTGRYTGLSVAAPGMEKRTVSMAGNPLEINFYDYVWYEEDENGVSPEPTTLRSCYTTGEEERVSLRPGTPWEQFNLASSHPEDIGGKIDAVIWMESDGMHASITNGSALKLKEGRVLTNFGYVSVPALAPGESADVAMLRPTDNSLNGYPAEDGKLYLDNSSGISYMMYYSLGLNENNAWSAGGMAGVKRSMLEGVISQMAGDYTYGTYGASTFLYYAEPEGAEVPEIRVDGNKVSGVGGMTLLSVEMDYRAVGNTGTVFHAPGMDEAVRVDLDENGLPGAEMQLSQYSKYYHSLNETPTFRFTLESPQEVKTERLRINMETWYTNQAAVYALNPATREWEEISLNSDIPDPQRYLGADGTFCVQFRPLTLDSYADIPTPTILLEGRTVHAAD